ATSSADRNSRARLADDVEFDAVHKGGGGLRHDSVHVDRLTKGDGDAGAPVPQHLQVIERRGNVPLVVTHQDRHDANEFLVLKSVAGINSDPGRSLFELEKLTGGADFAFRIHADFDAVDEQVDGRRNHRATVGAVHRKAAHAAHDDSH